MFVAIVPAYNEGRTIERVVKELLSCVDSVIVVDDGSTDATAQKAKQAGAVVLSHKINRGQGAALETGHEYARKIGADYVLHFDADLQFDIQDIVPAFHALQESKADILVGSRYLDNRSNIPFTKRYILSPISRVVDFLFGGLKLTDAHNGFRILSKRALRSIVITHEGMAHATEIPRLVKKNKLTYIEFPVKVTYHEYGQNLFGGINVVKDLILGFFLHK
ncbi:MAG: hypothetical protein COV59_03670 [Candidatus Magasanikbacteria bacterium CG11_big_fil_rev_8_21_14_0_20_39_34]|uniref:Glycosyltransferase 2-like domain-containing protein n=1 Tax=Candidatus Magasanikbacteria bacterium CG11_big_fil_rev_8_21_14_0_20_39_34 TaxID=1974653 RepID=A0A2H0N5T0_9BACT|nr:MAG: hypothetical protein COV59_03670 [Candidatus Magasanikbacteria bacterium CG11_big_fil_rev_8_21_14_0_20_39_34]